MKKKIGILVFLCVAAFSFMGLSVNHANALTADEFNTPIVITQGVYDDYANDNALKSVVTSNIQGEIGEYKGKFYDTYKNNLMQDNPIVQIIPRELFLHRGEYTYVGTEYGFYVRTRENMLHTNTSTVFLFDLRYDLTLNNVDKMTLKIAPLFCYEFAYLTLEDSFQYRPEEYLENGKYTGLQDPVQYSVSNALTDIVCAVPFDGAYQENPNYYIKDVISVVNLLNENHLNCGDDGYDPYQDDGSFIIETQTAYSGYSPQDAGEKRHEIYGSVVHYMIGHTPLKAAQIVSEFFSVVNLISDLVVLGTEQFGEVTNVQSNERFTPLANENFVSRQSQIAN